MSDTYCVTMTPVFREHGEEHFCKVIHDELAALIAVGKVRFRCGLDAYNFKDPYDSFVALVGGHTQDHAVEPDGRWSSGFSASYGWFDIMVNIFREAAKGLANGGKITIESYSSGVDDYEYYVDSDRVYCRTSNILDENIEDCGPALKGECV